MSKTKIILSLVAVIAVAAFFVMRGAKPAQPATADVVKPALTVTTVAPELRDWPQRLSASGPVLAWQEAIIGAEVGGVRLVELRANIGDKVKKGQELARLSDETLSADMQQQQAAFDEASARYDEAEANAKRALSIKDSGVMSAQEMQQFANAAAIAKAQKQAAAARLQSARLKVQYTHIVAPDDGLISARSATLGSVSQQGTEMFRMIRQGKLEWRAELTAAQVQLIRVGQKVRVHDGSEDTAQGVVTRIAPALDVVTRSGYAYIALSGAQSLRAGMFAEGEFDLGKRNALTVPQGAVVIRDGYSYVYKVGKDGRVEQMKIETGRRADDRIEVVRGLTADAQVVASGAGFLSDGDLVNVVTVLPKLKAASALSLELHSNI
ncbi:MAG: efflux RND transporter periplasmic adaptor subunit [Gallionella sp.]